MFNRILGGGGRPLPVAVIQSVEQLTLVAPHSFYISSIRVIITCNKNFSFTACSYTGGYICYVALSEEYAPVEQLSLQAGKTYTVDIAALQPYAKHGAKFTDRVNFLADGELFYTTDQSYHLECAFS